MATDQEIALTRSDDDAEQTRSARRPGWSTGKAALGVGVAVLLLGTVASFIQGGVASGADALDSVIQSRAVADHGRVLTEDELVKVRGLVEKTPNHLRQLTLAATAASTPSSVSKECQTAVQKQMAESTQKLVTLTLNTFFKCYAWGLVSKIPSAFSVQATAANVKAECEAAQGKMLTFDEDQKTECKASNKYCEVVQHVGQKSTPSTMCSPTECHAFEDLFQDVYTAQVNSTCSQCSVEVTCGGP
jgi:hypothetical protein